MAWHTAKGVAVASYGPTLGIAAGAWRAWGTRRGMRWPFLGEMRTRGKGEGGVGEEGIRLGKGRGWFEGVWDGERVRVGGREVLGEVGRETKAGLLHGMRGAAYVSLGLLVVPGLVSAYGVTVTAVGEVRDGRLKNLTAELRRAMVRERAERVEGGRGQGQGWGREKGKGGQVGDGVERARGRARGRAAGEREVDGAAVDEASPTGNPGMGVYGDDAAGAVADMGAVLSDGDMQTQERQVKPARRHSPAENSASTFRVEEVAKQPRSFADDFDDASPTGGSGVMGDYSSSSSSSSSSAEGGSVWERIRNQNASGAASSPTTTREYGGGRGAAAGRGKGEKVDGGESFSFSSAEEERQLAKDEAQKDFDARIERERQGGDFSSGREKRW